jgi:hypothetical protein
MNKELSSLLFETQRRNFLAHLEFFLMSLVTNLGLVETTLLKKMETAILIV